VLKLESLRDLLKNDVKTLREAADMVPKLICFFQEKIKQLKEKEEGSIEILLPFDVYETIFSYMCYSNDFQKTLSWEKRRAGIFGSLDDVNFRVSFNNSGPEERFDNYLFYLCEDGSLKKIE
jgi:hypothetical protein